MCQQDNIFFSCNFATPNPAVYNLGFFSGRYEGSLSSFFDLHFILHLPSEEYAELKKKETRTLILVFWKYTGIKHLEQYFFYKGTLHIAGNIRVA